MQNSSCQHDYKTIFPVKGIIHSKIHMWYYINHKSIFLERLLQTHAVSAIPLSSNKTRHWIAIHMDEQCTATASACLFLRTIAIEKIITHYFLCPYSCIHPRQMSVLMS
jgi:hypothetical protein